MIHCTTLTTPKIADKTARTVSVIELGFLSLYDRRVHFVFESFDPRT